VFLCVVWTNAGEQTVSSLVWVEECALNTQILGWVVLKWFEWITSVLDPDRYFYEIPGVVHFLGWAWVIRWLNCDDFGFQRSLSDSLHWLWLVRLVFLGKSWSLNCLSLTHHNVGFIIQEAHHNVDSLILGKVGPWTACYWHWLLYC
jgi:hypothetical protein